MTPGAETAEAAQRTMPIPALTTNSTRAILNAFGDSVIQLTASSSVVTTNQTLVEDLREYGVLREQETKQQLEIDYTQLQTSDSPDSDNPWDEAAISSLFENVEAILDAESQSVTPDLAVQSFTIRITDEALKAVTPARTPEFDLYFEAAPAEEGIREQTRRANADRNLYTELGFNVTNLNLLSVIETATKFTEQSNGQYHSWNGPQNDTRPNITPQLSVRINDRVLPEQYGTLKQYHVVNDEVLELSTDDLEVNETSTQPPEAEAES